ncbi:MAG TPA: SDR family oxidoreductase [Myxococcales bacterium]|jgi:NAD(P)-dependent dehydrogenase (short-subunit alcohol dehydrogenase family)
MERSTQTVLITGAARGIGACIAEEFARTGARLVLTDRDAAALAGTVGRLRTAGADVVERVVDVTDKEQVDSLAEQVLSRFDGLDVLVNNAGVGFSAELAQTPVETWKRLFDVNFWGPLYHVYAFLPSMRARRSGHVVNVSSGQAWFRLPSWGAYAVAKLALGAFSELLRFEVARDGVRVSTVYPYLVMTGFYDQVAPATLAGRVSLRLMPWYADTPQKVAKLVREAVRKNKPVERVNVLNSVGYYSRLIPPVSDAMARVGTWLFARGPAPGHG